MSTVHRVGNVQLMQTMNRIKVFEHIRQNEPTTRPAIAAKTGLSVSSITNIVSHLIDRGLVREIALETSGYVGRRATLLGVRTGIHRIISVGVEHDHIQFWMADLRGNVIHEQRAELSEKGPERLLAQIASGVHDMLPLAGRAPVVALALAVPGVVLDDGRRVSSISMRWKALDFKGPLEARFSIPVFIQNVSIARAMWVLSEARRESDPDSIPKNAAFLDLDRGVGAVHITDNRINPWFLGEIGHTTVDPNGAPCFCGNVGCIEGYCMPEHVVSACMPALQAGKAPILSEIIASHGGEPSFTDIAQAAARGEACALDAIAECAKYIGICLTNLLNTLSPSVIYVNAAILGQSALLTDAACTWAARHALAGPAGQVRYLPVHADGNAVRRGLTEYALDRLLVPEYVDCLIG